MEIAAEIKITTTRASTKKRMKRAKTIFGHSLLKLQGKLQAFVDSRLIAYM